ncbi:hypothetical protein [Streptomyces sp. NPDC086182]|uniref:hypothetical protein n=1 Tax=Streptomyces sp. NPDC086182 TaxID=3155058 RepID=UPI00343B57DF
MSLRNAPTAALPVALAGSEAGGWAGRVSTLRPCDNVSSVSRHRSSAGPGHSGAGPRNVQYDTELPGAREA